MEVRSEGEDGSTLEEGWREVRSKRGEKLSRSASEDSEGWNKKNIKCVVRVWIKLV